MAEPRALCCSTICTAFLLSVLGLNLRSIAPAALLVQGAIKKANAGGMYQAPSRYSVQRYSLQQMLDRYLGVIFSGSARVIENCFVLTHY